MSDFNTEFTSDNSYGNPQPKLKVPNATVVLIMGILGILCCLFYGAGIIFSIIGLVLAASGKRAYMANPENYDESSYGLLKTGRIISIIGLILWLLVILIAIISFAAFGVEGFKAFAECAEITDIAERQECITDYLENR